MAGSKAPPASFSCSQKALRLSYRQLMCAHRSGAQASSCHTPPSPPSPHRASRTRLMEQWTELKHNYARSF
eukprot:753307-Hanusia_phi.AAC.1